MSDYVKDLRALVGTRPLILPGTSVVVVDESGRILLIERTDTGGWGLPGGLMDPGESFEETGRREVFEEIGIKIEEMSLLGLFSGAEYYYRYPHGDEIYNVTVAYVARMPHGVELALDPAEARRAAFFDLADIPQDLIGPEKPIITKYAQEWNAS